MAKKTYDILIEKFDDPEEGKAVVRATIEATAAFVMGLIEFNGGTPGVELINAAPEVFMREVSTAILKVRSKADVDGFYQVVTDAMKKAVSNE